MCVVTHVNNIAKTAQFQHHIADIKNVTYSVATAKHADQDFVSVRQLSRMHEKFENTFYLILQGFCVKDMNQDEDDPLVVSKYRSLSHMNAQHIIHLADQNKDGWFNITEAKKWISRLRSDLSEAHIETEVIKLDRNKDGYLSHREIDEEDFD